MLKKFPLTALLSLLFVSLSLADPDYNISSIPGELRKDAIAVVRKSNTILYIQSPSKVTRKIQYAITILNDKGKDYGNLYIGYDNFSQVKNIELNVYSKDGTHLRKIKSSDIRDQSYYSNYILYSDNRIKYYEIYHTSYPYTVEYSYEIVYDGMMGYPFWQPVRFYNISVEKADLEVILSPGMKFHYKGCNIPNDAEINETKDGTVWHWKVENIPAYEQEYFSPNLVNYTPVIHLAPDEFFYDGASGNLSSWMSYGSWLYELIKSRDLLPEETVAKIKSMVYGIDDEKQKAKIVYEYMQSKTRYVSVQLGIGGFQPYPASEVDKVGYGDCKALSNYTRALLSAAGIKSYYAEIGSGSECEIMFDDFSSTNQTNHVILCAILSGDTIWLECTNQKIPFGYISRNNVGRKALLITEEGGKIVKTPEYPMELNTQVRNACVTIFEDKQAVAEIRTIYSGLQYESVAGIINASNKEQKDYLYETLKLKDFEITGFGYSEKKDIVPEISENISVKTNNYASIAGNRLIIPLNLLNRWKYLPDSTRERKTDIVFRMPFYDSDTIRFNIPQNYLLDFLPKDQKFTSVFGEYISSVRYSDSTITYSRNLWIKKGKYTPEKYDEFVDFFISICKSDDCKAILVKGN
jgi:transglutaminase-like putative cysteine protease